MNASKFIVNLGFRQISGPLIIHHRMVKTSGIKVNKFALHFFFIYKYNAYKYTKAYMSIQASLKKF